MTRLALTHLTFIGTNVSPASVEFGARAAIIRGPSDTGKSFMVDAIDFVLGATSLKEIPERTGYSTALLGLALAPLDVPDQPGALGCEDLNAPWLTHAGNAPLPLS